MTYGWSSTVGLVVVCCEAALLVAAGCKPVGGGCDGSGGYGLGGGDVVTHGYVGTGGAGGTDAQGEEVPCFGTPATEYIDCRKRGLSASACSQACIAAGTGCGPFAGHPYKSGEGIGQLTWCKNGKPSYTCTYTFANKDGCAGVFSPPSWSPFWICVYAGGK